MIKKKYLVALPASPREKGFCHQTILVAALDQNDAISIVKKLRPKSNIGEIKQVNY